MKLLLPENENDLNFKILPKIMKEVFSKTSTKISMFLYIMWGHGCFKLKSQLPVHWKLPSLPRCTGPGPLWCPEGLPSAVQQCSLGLLPCPGE